MTTKRKPVLTPRKLAARTRHGQLQVTLDSGRFTCSVCGRRDQRSRAGDPRNWSSGDRTYCPKCKGYTVPRIEFDEVILDLVTDRKVKEPVVRFNRIGEPKEEDHV